MEAARQLQRDRFEGTRQETDPGSTRSIGTSPLPIACNADMQPADVRLHCPLDDTCRALMHSAMDQLHLSARAIADLAGCEEIGPSHLALGSAQYGA